jgi:hypothetical protein
VNSEAFTPLVWTYGQARKEDGEDKGKGHIDHIGGHIGRTTGGKKKKKNSKKGVQRKRREAKGREQEKKRTQKPQGKRNLSKIWMKP